MLKLLIVFLCILKIKAENENYFKPKFPTKRRISDVFQSGKPTSLFNNKGRLYSPNKVYQSVIRSSTGRKIGFRPTSTKGIEYVKSPNFSSFKKHSEKVTKPYPSYVPGRQRSEKMKVNNLSENLKNLQGNRNAVLTQNNKQTMSPNLRKKYKLGSSLKNQERDSEFASEDKQESNEGLNNELYNRLQNSLEDGENENQSDSYDNDQISTLKSDSLEDKLEDYPVDITDDTTEQHLTPEVEFNPEKGDGVSLIFSLLNLNTLKPNSRYYFAGNKLMINVMTACPEAVTQKNSIKHSSTRTTSRTVCQSKEEEEEDENTAQSLWSNMRVECKTMRLPFTLKRWPEITLPSTRSPEIAYNKRINENAHKTKTVETISPKKKTTHSYGRSLSIKEKGFHTSPSTLLSNNLESTMATICIPIVTKCFPLLEPIIPSSKENTDLHPSPGESTTELTSTTLSVPVVPSSNSHSSSSTENTNAHTSKPTSASISTTSSVSRSSSENTDIYTSPSEPTSESRSTAPLIQVAVQHSSSSTKNNDVSTSSERTSESTSTSSSIPVVASQCSSCTENTDVYTSSESTSESISSPSRVPVVEVSHSSSCTKHTYVCTYPSSESSGVGECIEIFGSFIPSSTSESISSTSRVPVVVLHSSSSTENTDDYTSPSEGTLGSTSTKSRIPVVVSHSSSSTKNTGVSTSSSEPTSESICTTSRVPVVGLVSHSSSSTQNTDVCTSPSELTSTSITTTSRVPVVVSHSSSSTENADRQVHTSSSEISSLSMGSSTILNNTSTNVLLTICPVRVPNSVSSTANSDRKVRPSETSTVEVQRSTLPTLTRGEPSLSDVNKNTGTSTDRIISLFLNPLVQLEKLALPITPSATREPNKTTTSSLLGTSSSQDMKSTNNCGSMEATNSCSGKDPQLKNVSLAEEHLNDSQMMSFSPPPLEVFSHEPESIETLFTEKKMSLGFFGNDPFEKKSTDTREQGVSKIEDLFEPGCHDVATNIVETSKEINKAAINEISSGETRSDEPTCTGTFSQGPIKAFFTEEMVFSNVSRCFEEYSRLFSELGNRKNYIS